MLNNFNVDEFHEDDLIIIENYFKSNMNHFNSDDLKFETSIKNKDWEMFSVKHMYKTIFEESQVCASYKRKILIVWNGERQLMSDIFKNESQIIFNPSVVYSLYSLFFKYCAAIVFYRIKESLLTRQKRYMIKTFVPIKLKLTHENWQDFFPIAMKSILNDIENVFLCSSIK